MVKYKHDELKPNKFNTLVSKAAEKLEAVFVLAIPGQFNTKQPKFGCDSKPGVQYH